MLTFGIFSYKIHLYLGLYNIKFFINIYKVVYTIIYQIKNKIKYFSIYYVYFVNINIF
mgnify:FL=1